MLRSTVHNVRDAPVNLHRLAPPRVVETKTPLNMGRLRVKPPVFGAPGRSRTHNLLIRSQALYPLSYWGVTAIIPDL